MLIVYDYMVIVQYPIQFSDVLLMRVDPSRRVVVLTRARQIYYVHDPYYQYRGKIYSRFSRILNKYFFGTSYVVMYARDSNLQMHNNVLRNVKYLSSIKTVCSSLKMRISI